PRGEGIAEHLAHDRGILTGVLVGEQLAVRRQAVDSLPGGTALTLARPLVGDLAEELADGIVAAPLVPVVGTDRHEVLRRHADDFSIGESGLTARNHVVSTTAERMAVHFPEQDRLPLCRGLLACLPEIGLPGNAGPPVLAGLRLDHGPQTVELIRL